MLKNRIIAIFAIAVFSLPTFAVNDINTVELEDINPEIETIVPKDELSENGTAETEATAVTEQTQNTAEQNIISSKTENQTPYKQPISKKQIIKKFLLAMLGVAGSSIILFALLSIYNRVRFGSNNRKEFFGEETPLTTPDNIHGAVRTFVDKTKWDN